MCQRPSKNQDKNNQKWLPRLSVGHATSTVRYCPCPSTFWSERNLLHAQLHFSPAAGSTLPTHEIDGIECIWCRNHHV